MRERFRSDLVNGSEEPAIREAHQLYLNALKLSPSAPTMLEMRDALLLDDLVRNPAPAAAGGSANFCRIWETFAGRGMGELAQDTKDTGTDRDVVADTSVPADCVDDPGVDPSHQITSVLDAASFLGLISPGSIVSVFGSFAEQTAVDDTIPLQPNLNGLSVTFDDIPGALFGVFGDDFGLGFNQANAQVPWNVDVSDGEIEVRVHWQDDTGETWSEPFAVTAALASPGIYMFPSGTTQAIVTNFKSSEEDDVIAGSWAQPPGSIDPVVGQPAAIGGVAIIWSNGLGPVSPLPATGDLPMPPGTAPLPDKSVRVFVGGVEAQVLGAVLQATSVGLNQINIVIPEGVTPGDAVPIVIEVECPDGTKLRSRDDVTIAVRAAP